MTSAPPSAGGAEALHAPILSWYAEHARTLPWREPDCTAWGVLVCEVMSQQTPVGRIIAPWRAWLQRWPTPADLAADTPAEAIRMWGGLGYPRRAVRLHELARVLVADFGGEVPQEEATLRTLPGVGEYTAAAVTAFAFGQRSTVIDTNVRRVLARALTGRALPAPALTAAERRLALDATPIEVTVSATWNVAVMEVGALICTARAPRCEQCPVTDLCAWFRAGRPEEDRPRRPRPGYAGTDRQVRGRILHLLRTHPQEVARSASVLPRSAFDDCDPDPTRVDRCLAGLIEDRLVEPVGSGRYRLPS
ncbi:MAG: A/G-specific adenine glycosylase [Nostocoides sp.]